MACRPPQILPPPYRRFIPFEPVRQPPLGSILLIAGMSELGELQEMVGEAFRLMPWAAMAAWVNRQEAARYEVAMPSIRAEVGAAVALVVPPSGLHPTPAEVVAAVARRRPPSGEQLGRWTANRLRRPDLADALGGAMGHGLPLVHPVAGATIRRRLAANGLPKRIEWTWLGELALEDRLRWDARTLGRDGPARMRRWEARLQRILGVSFRTWRQRPGWEWVVDRALRRWTPFMAPPTCFSCKVGPWTLPQGTRPVAPYRPVDWACDFGLPGTKALVRRT